MAGHVQDRWYKIDVGDDGETRKVKTDRYGTGMRYRARYVGPDGSEKSKSFPDRQKRLAEQWLSAIEADMSRGQYIDPKTSRTTFQQYAEKWAAAQTTDLVTRDAVERRLRLHALPYLGTRPLGSFQPAHIRAWLRELENAGVPGSHAYVIYGNVRAVLSAAVDDGYLARNPCDAQSVRAPSADAKRVIPWLPERVFAVRAALAELFRPMVDLGAGCGMRQGEIFGLGVDGVDYGTDTVHVVRQVKLINGKPVFAPPKCDKERDVPLPASVAATLQEHSDRHPPTAVTLPWKKPDGPMVTARLLFTGLEGGAIRRNDFNTYSWKPALAAAGVIPERKPGERYASAREHGMHALRHFYASVLLDAGESIRAVSDYLGHADPSLTLRVYAHLMPSSRERTRSAVDAVLGCGPAAP
ncbi:tyrosine-type recombinase/integrase [Streptomyces alkaliterrae]|uniref:Site-specific integrase n=1 Tax=Streptomyces alkaliterrae TaxID=2213162 RepID=A0A5P0YMX6_9ACTN|nr:tyrosine-type recombinase/integrase [Streptomyces alkaliterrae]MBB1256359.1 site-specific integrase [Streptomyces alkaliterrae]MBB1262244.1 site-specific integrase [Streptomyces alkaliterrae]MQS01611.1 tyrosine-type recombinase/integrase [Streptomyces alkaliterrae]